MVNLQSLKRLMKNWMIWGIGIVIGAAGGYLYWYFIGCGSGSYAITSLPVNSTLYGGLMGGLVGNLFSTPKSGIENSNPEK